MRSPTIRGAYALCAASFLFFLLYSAPHRVHHLLDRVDPVSQVDSGDHHGKTDQQNQLPDNSDCVFQASVNRCAFGVTAQFQLQPEALLFESLLVFHDIIRPQQHLAAAFQIRAPPIT